MIGTTISRDTILENLGSRSMGVMCDAEDTHLNSPLAQQAAYKTIKFHRLMRGLSI